MRKKEIEGIKQLLRLRKRGRSDQLTTTKVSPKFPQPNSPKKNKCAFGKNPRIWGFRADCRTPAKSEIDQFFKINEGWKHK